MSEADVVPLAVVLVESGGCVEDESGGGAVVDEAGCVVDAVVSVAEVSVAEVESEAEEDVSVEVVELEAASEEAEAEDGPWTGEVVEEESGGDDEPEPVGTSDADVDDMGKRG